MRRISILVQVGEGVGPVAGQVAVPTNFDAALPNDILDDFERR